MKDCALIDFDNTLVSIDTTKYLVIELIKLNPSRFINAAFYCIRLLLAKDQNYIQKNKNMLIGCLIEGLTAEDIKIALKKFSKKVNKFLRHKLVKRIYEHHDNDVVVLVVTASPTFAVKACLYDLPVEVIGTDYKKNLERFGPADTFKSCYGNNKVIRLNDWQKKNEKHLNFIESWSDSFSDYPIAIMANNRFWIGGNELKKEMNFKDPNGIFISNS